MSELDIPPPMVEVELLPQWYPVMVRRRRRLIVQAWLTGLLLVVLVGVLIWRRANVEATHFELASLGQQRRQTDAMLEALEREEARLSSLLRQAELVSKMGVPLEVSRILADIGAGLPDDVAITSFTTRTEERAPAGPNPSRGKQPDPVRQMHFAFTGLAEQAESVGTISRHLEDRPLLKNVRISAQQNTLVYGRPAVAFEIGFRVDLSPAGGALSSTKEAS